MIGASGYPLIKPFSFISKPGRSLPCANLIVTSLVGIGLLYSTCNSRQTLSLVLSIVPVGVVNVGVATPLISMLNALSAISVALLASDALTAKLYTVSTPTLPGVPDKIPVVLFSVNPLGNEPLNTV